MADRKSYGKAVDNGQLRYLSPSAMTVADPVNDGCLRKWWYQYVRGIKSPPSRGQERGTALHAEIERYLKTGERSLSSLALSGLHMVPDPGPGLGIELDITVDPEIEAIARDAEIEERYEDAARIRAQMTLADAPVKCAGVPVVGYIDLVHNRGTNKGGTNVEETIDPPETVEVIDWKSTSNARWIKSAREVASTPQMTTYGKWVTTVEPAVQHVRLSHGYFVERGGTSRKVSLLVRPEDIDRNWEHCEGVARSVVDAAKESNPDLVPANTRACDRFGGCPAREVCTARMHQALANFVGITQADKLLGRQDNAMGLFDKLKAEAAARTSALSTPPSNVTGTTLTGNPGVTTVPSTTGPAETTLTIGNLGSIFSASTSTADARANLEAEEAAARATAQIQIAADKFAPVLAKLEAYAAANPDVGMPTLKDHVAQCYYAIKKQAGTSPIVGSGKLAAMSISAIVEADSLANQLDAAAGEKKINPMASSSSSVPSMTSTAPIGVIALLSPETPAPMLQAPPAAVTTVTVSQPPSIIVTPQGPPPGVPSLPTPQAAPEPEKKRTRKTASEAPAQAAQAQATVPAQTTTFNLLVDCVVEGLGPVQSFHPILNQIHAELIAMTGDADARCAADKSPLAYGKWEGGIASVLHERDLVGTFWLDTRGSRIAEVAADALREKCRKTGGIHVWGRR